MTLGPEDLPDPFGEGGLSQLVCRCTGENFHFIFTETTVRAICAQCGAQMGEWPGTPPMPPPPQQIPPHADAMWVGVPGAEVQGGGGGAGGAPGPAAGGPPQPAAGAGGGGGGLVPRLQAFSESTQNAYLQGGPYGGQSTWIPDGAQTFTIAGVATYRLTSERLNGQPVYRYDRVAG